MAYEERTISSIIADVDSKKVYLPAIQRKYVWNEDQITRLMDSIMRGYPFGTFLFWKVKKDVVNKKGYSMYEFIKEYHERDHYRNEQAAQPFAIAAGHEDETILSALDGQQRLTSLYISLKGSLSKKLPKKHWNNDDAFPKKELYFDLSSQAVSDDDDVAYKFAFLTEEEANNPVQGEIWFKVKEIDGYPSLTELNRLIRNSSWAEDEVASDNITLLYQRIKENKVINYFEVESDSIDDVLDVFVRVNSGGTVLSKTDLLFSTIVSYWDSGREEIDNLLGNINKIGDHYSFTNDFIMRACLYVMDLPISLKVESFKQENVNRIERSWSNIKIAIKDTVKTLNDLGFNSENIVADNAVLPLIYYRYHYGENAFDNASDSEPQVQLIDEKMEIRKYMVVAQIRHIFGQSTNTTLTSIRNELKQHQNEKFLLKHLQNLTFTGERSLSFDEKDIDNWFDTFEKNAYTFMLLSLLYPDLKYGQNEFHQDHMHPYSAFENEENLFSLSLPVGEMDSSKIQEWRHKRNTIANLQLLEGGDNLSKNDISLSEWLSDPTNKENVKYLPEGIDYSLANFDDFMIKRKELMFNQLKSILF